MTKGLKHGANKAHTCNKCGYSTIRAANLKRHMLIHNGEKPFDCKQCNYSCTTAESLKKHIRTHSGEKPFTCEQCPQGFKRREHLHNHMKVCRGAQKQLNTFICQYCDRTFSQNIHMKVHIKTKHSDSPFHYCRVCEVSIEKNQITAHNLSHRRWECDQCEKTVDIKNKRRHIRNHHIQTSSPNYNVHTKRVPECTHCGITFYDSSTLKRHNLRKHKNEIVPIEESTISMVEKDTLEEETRDTLQNVSQLVDLDESTLRIIDTPRMKDKLVRFANDTDFEISRENKGKNYISWLSPMRHTVEQPNSRFKFLPV